MNVLPPSFLSRQPGSQAARQPGKAVVRLPAPASWLARPTREWPGRSTHPGGRLRWKSTPASLVGQSWSAFLCFWEAPGEGRPGLLGPVAAVKARGHGGLIQALPKLGAAVAAGPELKAAAPLVPESDVTDVCCINSWLFRVQE